MTVTVLLLFPDSGESVIHVTLLLTVQLVLEVMVNCFCSPDAVTLNEVGSMDKVVVFPVKDPSCVIRIICAFSSRRKVLKFKTEISAVLGLVLGLTVAVTVTKFEKKSVPS